MGKSVDVSAFTTCSGYNVCPTGARVAWWASANPSVPLHTTPRVRRSQPPLPPVARGCGAVWQRCGRCWEVAVCRPVYPVCLRTALLCPLPIQRQPVGLLDDGEKNHKHDHFGQYWNQDYWNYYFWVWKHDAFIEHFSPKKTLWNCPLKIMCKYVSSCSGISIKHLMNKINISKNIYIV